MNGEYYDDMRHGDPILETAYYLAVARRGETRVLLVQGRSVEQTGPVAIVSSRSTPAADFPPKSKSFGT